METEQTLQDSLALPHFVAFLEERNRRSIVSFYLQVNERKEMPQEERLKRAMEIKKKFFVAGKDSLPQPIISAVAQMCVGDEADKVILDMILLLH